MKIYYAHHLWKYKTDIEHFELRIIKEYFDNCEIFNPSTDINQNLTTAEIMSECLYQVINSNVLVFSTISGIVGKGVVSEVNTALGNKKPVYMIINDKIKRIRKFRYKIIDRNNYVYAIVRR